MKSARGSRPAFFCPIDAGLCRPPARSSSLDDLYKELESGGAGSKLLLVDACRNDPLARVSRRATVDLASVTRPTGPPPPGGVAALFSCSTGEKAFEHPELKHGVFFHYVIEGLHGKAARANDGRVTLPLLEDYVKENVERFVRDKFDQRQIPERLGQQRGTLTLAINSSSRPAGKVPSALETARRDGTQHRGCSPENPLLEVTPVQQVAAPARRPVPREGAPLASHG